MSTNEIILLRHPRIQIYYASCRENDAKTVEKRYRQLEALVEVRRISDKRARRHESRLYFSRKGTRWHSIATKIAQNLSKIENLSINYAKEYSHAEFAIYLAPQKKFSRPTKKRVQQSIFFSREGQNIQNGFGGKKCENASFCIHCPAVFISKSRLEKHLRKAHRRNLNVVEAPKIHFWNEDATKGLSIGAPTLRGQTTPNRIKTLRPKKGTRMCRICCEYHPMYNASECYMHNPK